MNDTHSEDEEVGARFDDAIRILAIAKETSGLPFPQVGRNHAAFHFSGITHDCDAAYAVGFAEAYLSEKLGVTFMPYWPEEKGSTRHYILRAELPSGLMVDIVALARHVYGLGAAGPKPELAVA
jgi:hypothetical protein